MRLLYAFGEEFTGQRAREVHTLHRAHSLAQAGVDVVLVAGLSRQFRDPNALLAHFDLQPHSRLHMHFLPRQAGLGPFRITSTRFFYAALDRWLAGQVPFDAGYVIHLKAADHLQRAQAQMPLVFEAHEIFADSFPAGSSKFEALALQEKRIYQRSRAVVGTSQFLLDELRQRYAPPGAFLISPNCVEPRFFGVPLNEALPNRVIYAGSFQQWKGVDVAVAAMKFLPEHRLTLVGGRADQIESLKKCNVPNLEFCGYQPRSELCRHLAQAGVALIPNRLKPRSSLYSFPMKLVEYAAAGRLVAASDMPVLRELKLGDWARLVESENPRALADAIRELSSLESSVRRVSAREWARGFTWEAQAMRIRDFLENVVAAKGSV